MATKITFNELNKSIQNQMNAVSKGNEGLKRLLDFANQYFQIVNKSELNEGKFAAAMRQRTKATDVQIQSMIQLVAQQERMGVADKITQISGTQQLATYAKQSQSIQILLPAINNLLARQKGLNATQEDAVNIGDMMGRTLAGQTDALEKTGVSFSKAQKNILQYGNEQQKAAMLARVVNQTTGPANKALANTYPGKLAKARNMFGNMQEEINAPLVPIKIKLMEWTIDNLPKVKPIVEALTVAYKANELALLGVTAAEKGGMIISALSKAWSYATTVLALMREGTSLAAIVQMELNLAMAANPAGFIIAAITALVIAGYYLIKNWDTVKTFFIGLWDRIKTVFSTALNYIWSLFDNRYIQAALAIFAPFIGLPVALIKNWQTIKEFFSGLWGGIVTGWKMELNALISLLNLFISALNSLKFQVPDWVPGMGGETLGLNIPRIPMLAEGASYFRGGPAIIGEQGPELVNMPRGTQVIPNNRTQRLLNGWSGGSSSPVSVTYSPQITIQGNADHEVLKAANDQAYQDFERRFDALLNRRRRLNFA